MTAHPFADMPVIFQYTRADAIADGVLIEVPPLYLLLAGIRYPVAITTEAWEQLVEWTDADTRHLAKRQSVARRLYTLLCQFRAAVLALDGADECLIKFNVLAHCRKANTQHAITHQLRAVCGPGDTPEPVITIMLPHED